MIVLGIVGCWTGHTCEDVSKLGILSGLGELECALGYIGVLFVVEIEEFESDKAVSTWSVVAFIVCNGELSLGSSNSLETMLHHSGDLSEVL
jgi:hypothetical protein